MCLCVYVCVSGSRVYTVAIPNANNHQLHVFCMCCEMYILALA